MVNSVNNTYPGMIESYTKFTASNKLSDGTSLQTAVGDAQTTGHAAQYDRLELSQEQSQVTLDVPEECPLPAKIDRKKVKKTE